MNFYASSERLNYAGPCSPTDTCGFAVVMTFLSWDSAPLHRSHKRMSRPATCEQMTSVCRLPAPYRSALWFCTTSTAYSTLEPPGLLHPGHGHRVRHVSWKRPSIATPKCRTGRACLPFPAARVHTPRRIPLTGSRSASLRSLPSCCYFPCLSPCPTETEASAEPALAEARTPLRVQSSDTSKLMSRWSVRRPATSSSSTRRPSTARTGTC